MSARWTSIQTRKLLPAILIGVIVVLAGSHVWAQTDMREGDVLFICKHGNVKSLMAASYFNRLAAERGLPYRASARGVAVDTPKVPPEIAAKLATDGFDVSGFRAAAANAADLARAERIVLIETSLPDAPVEAGSKTEHWDDVPPASVDYSAARNALKAHVERLLDQLSSR